MMNTNSVDNKADKALESIDTIERASISPYFFQKLMLRLEQPKEDLVDKWNSLLLKPSISLTVICFTILLNIAVVFYNLKPSKTTIDQNGVALTEEYNQTTVPAFYLENPKP